MLDLWTLHRVVKWVLPYIERWTEAPIMRQRINEGSDQYFAWRDAHAGETDLDEVLDPFSIPPKDE
jgi:hypothetical protein